MTLEKTWDDYVDSGECANCGLLADLMGGVGADDGLLSGFGAKQFTDKNGDHHTVCCTCYDLLKKKAMLSVRLCQRHHAAGLLDKAGLVEFYQTPLQEIATMERSRFIRSTHRGASSSDAVTCRQIADTMRESAYSVLRRLPPPECITRLSLVYAEDIDGRTQKIMD